VVIQDRWRRRTVTVNERHCPGPSGSRVARPVWVPSAGLDNPLPHLCRRKDVSIDIDKLVRRSARLDVEDLDLGVFSAQPLDPDTLRCLRYMHDVESHTVCYLRDILVTSAHKDRRSPPSSRAGTTRSTGTVRPSARSSTPTARWPDGAVWPRCAVAYRKRTHCDR